MTKECNRCGKEKSLESFSPHAEGRYGHYGTCKTCINAKNRIRREERAVKEGREYQPRPETDEERKERRRVSKLKSLLKYKYNLSWDRYQEMLEDQEGCCAICKRHADEFHSRLHVDHDRSCCPRSESCGGCVRALLCFSCNSGLGSFHDSVETMMAAIEYVERYAVNALV